MTQDCYLRSSTNHLNSIIIWLTLSGIYSRIYMVLLYVIITRGYLLYYLYPVTENLYAFSAKSGKSGRVLKTLPLVWWNFSAQMMRLFRSDDEIFPLSYWNLSA